MAIPSRVTPRIGIIIAAILAMASALYAQSAFEGYPKDIRAILERGKLVVAMTASDQYPFFFVTPDGGIDGLDVRLARRIAEELKVEVDFNRNAASFNDVVAEVIAGRADVAISKLSQTLARAQRVIFTKPYITFRHALMLNRLKLARFTSEDNLVSFLKKLREPGVSFPEPFTIGVIEKSSYVGFCARYFPNAKVIEYPNWDAAKKAAFDGEVIAIYRDELEIMKINAERSDASLKLKTVVLADLKDPIAMAVAADSALFAKWLDIFLEREGLSYDAESLLKEFAKKEGK